MTNSVTITSKFLFNLFPEKMGESAQAVPEELLSLSEEDLVKKVYGDWDNIPPIDVELRRNFWVKYPLAIASEEKMSANSLHKGICSRDGFYRVINDPMRTAFILTEPANEKVKAQHLLFLGWRKMKKIMESKPGTDNKTGLSDTKLMDLQFKIFCYLDQRENGSIVQRQEINQKTLQVNMNAEQAKELHTHLTPQQIDEKLAALEERASLPAANSQPEILDTISHAEKEHSTTIRTVTESKKKDQWKS